MISNRFDDPLEVRNDPKRSFEVIFLNFKRQFRIRVETTIMQQLNINLSNKLFDLNWVLSSLVWKSRDLFRVISMRNRRIPDIKAVFDQKFIFLSHVTLWWCPELSPPDTLVIFNILFLSLRTRLWIEEENSIYSISVSYFFGGVTNFGIRVNN